MRIEIEVRNSHLVRGEPKEKHNCAVALALKEYFQLPAAVDGFTMKVGDKKFLTPNEVFTFIQRYDKGQDCGPFTFELRV